MNPYLGPLQISLGRMLADILKFGILFVLGKGSIIFFNDPISGGGGVKVLTTKESRTFSLNSLNSFCRKKCKIGKELLRPSGEGGRCCWLFRTLCRRGHYNTYFVCVFPKTILLGKVGQKVFRKILKLALIQDLFLSFVLFI